MNPARETIRSFAFLHWTDKQGCNLHEVEVSMIARRFLSTALVAVVLAIAVPTFVAPVDAARSKKHTAKKVEKPNGATAQCKDGSYSSAKTRRGACTGHGGVATWLADTDAGTKVTPKAPTENPQSAPQTNAKVDTKAPGKSQAVGAPDNATAKCKDGTYSYAKTHRGACSHHGGVAEWYK
jgi:uncharacterized protein with FMN-binding domain